MVQGLTVIVGGGLVVGASLGCQIAGSGQLAVDSTG
jgi:hypothetical protein